MIRPIEALRTMAETCGVSKKDLIVLGISDPGFRRIGVVSISENIARKSDIPVALVNAPKKLESIVKRFV